MRRIYLVFCLTTALIQAGSLQAGAVNAPRALRLSQELRLGEFTMQITELEDAASDRASGKGVVYLPFWEENIAVQFKSIQVNDRGELLSGRVEALESGVPVPDYRSSEAAVTAYLAQTAGKGMLPWRLNPLLEARGMQFGAHDLVLTRLEFSEKGAFCDAVLLISNPDGRATVFGREQIPLQGSGLDFCALNFPLLGPDQSPDDPEFPIVIKRFNPDDGSGTYVTFSCEGFENFHLLGEYHFDNKTIRRVPALTEATLDTVVATFELVTEVWGQFLGTVRFNGPFEIAGVDDVIITVSDAFIDYSDTQNPESDTLGAYLAQLPVYAGKTLNWRGIYIDHIGIQLPASLSIGAGGSRISIDARHIIFDRPKGISTTFSVFGSPSIASGNLEGWGLSVDSLRLRVRYSSPQLFELKGGVQIPLVMETIPYKARFTFPSGGPSGTTGQASLNFDLKFDSTVFRVPFLNQARLSLNTSTAGFSYVNNKFTPYADLNGKFDLDFAEGSGIAASFKFPKLEFQHLTLNYNITSQQVMAQLEKSGGLKNMAIRAFVFSGTTYVTDPAAAPPPPPDPAAEATTPAQTVKGFPIALRNIRFASENDLKRLDFTLAINFTKPSVGITASADMSISGKLEISKLLSSKPWEALSFEGLALRNIAIGSEQTPVNIGGVSFYGGLTVISKHPTYGEGFKGFLKMSVEPGLRVDVVGQFGTIKTSSGALEYRYFFADARMSIPSGIRLGPIPLAVYGFGGGMYYNMTQTPISGLSALDVTQSAGAQPISSNPTLSTSLTEPGVGLSNFYVPRNNTLGLQATLVLGTHPKAETANMDLTLGIEFNTEPFGLRRVSFTGDVYMMAPIANRQSAKVKGSTSFVYNHATKTMTINGSIEIKVKVGNQNILTGGGSFAMFFNLNPGYGSDWYIAIGAPPIAHRMQLQFNLGTSQLLEGYFVAGNIDRLPPGQRNLPLLREYHPLLQEFEGQNPLDFTQLLGGNAILMGARYAYRLDKTYGVFGVNVGFTVGFDAMLFRPSYGCTCCQPIGIDGWYINGQLYGALDAGINIRVNLFFHKGRYNIASIRAAALINAELPNPTWMRASVAGSYRILGGLVKGRFSLSLEFGERCNRTGGNLDPGAVVANIKIIGDVLPQDNTNNVPVYREKLIVASYLEQINKVMDFSAESQDGLMVRPMIAGTSIAGPQTPMGNWQYLNASNQSVGINGYVDHMEFISERLLPARASYTFTLRIKWQKKTRDNATWSDVWLKNQQGQDSVMYYETKVVRFQTGNRPTQLPQEAVLGSYPDYKAIHYCIRENPAGGGISLKMPGWGFLFNPKKHARENVTPCDTQIVEYNYFVRVSEALSGREVFEGPLTAVPVPEWGQLVGDPVYQTQTPCETSNSFLNWLYKLFNISCKTVTQGTCAVRQPSRQAARSNVKNMPNSWNFGGSDKNFDLAVSQTSDVQDRAIGFPDFSAFLQKNQVYKLVLVAKPIYDESYTISAIQTSTTTVTTAEGTYEVSTASQTLTGQFSASPNKILYEYRFATSRYDNFVEKLSSLNPAHFMPQSWYLEPRDSVAFNKTDWNYSAGIKVKLGIVELSGSRKFSGYPVATADNKKVFDKYAKDAKANMENKRYELTGEEFFDAYEIGRLAWFTNFDRNTGYVQYVDQNLPTYTMRDKSSDAFGRWIVPRGPFALQYYPSTRLLNDTASVKPIATVIFLSFFPRTGSLYQMLNRHHAHLQTINIMGRNFVINSLNPYDLKANMDLLPLYRNLPASYDHLFRISYSKGGQSATMVLKKEGENSSSVLDLSGAYYLRVKGSGRTIQDASAMATSALSTADRSPVGNYHKFSLERQSNGNYKIKSVGLNRYVGSSSGAVLSAYTNPSEYRLSKLEDGSYRIENADGSNSALYERFELDPDNANHRKITQKGSSGTLNQNEDLDDYAAFFLDKNYVAPPSNLSGKYLIRVHATGRYLGDANNYLSTQSQGNNDRLRLTLKRCGDGFYEIWSKELVKKVYENNGELFIGDAPSGHSSERSRFKLIPQPSGRYHIQLKSNGQYLTQIFNLELTNLQRIGFVAEPGADGYAEFSLESTFQAPPVDLSGEYRIKYTTTGKHLHKAPNQFVFTPALADGPSLRFVLKQMAGGRYEIWSRSNQQRMCYGITGTALYTMNFMGYNISMELPTWGFVTSETALNSTGFLYEFQNQSGNTYKIFAVGQSGFLGDKSQKLDTLRNNAQTFLLESNFIPYVDLSLEYLVKNAGSAKFLYMDGNTLSASLEDKGAAAKFRLERSADGSYKMRSSLTGNYLYPDNMGRFKTAPSGTLTPNLDVFLFSSVSGNTFTIRNKLNARYMTEIFSATNGQENGLVKETLIPSITDGYAEFSLEPYYTAPNIPIANGDYFIKAVTSGRNVYLNVLEDLLFQPTSSSAANLQFVLKRIKNGHYELYSRHNGKRVNAYWPSGGGVFSATSSSPSFTTRNPAFNLNTNTQFEIKQVQGDVYRIKYSGLNKFLIEGPTARLNCGQNAQNFRIYKKFNQ